jgi:hypothetical protein
MATPRIQTPKGESERGKHDSQFYFSGEYMPSQDPIRIGPENFRTLKNLRYTDDGPEGVLGYTNVNNTTALATYTKIWNGIQFRSNRTQGTYVLVHAVDPVTGQGRVYENRTAIGSQGDFEGTHLHSDASVNLLGRFGDGPGGVITYCNGEENRIYAGDEVRVSGFFRIDDEASLTDSDAGNPVDYTERVNNTLSDSGNIFTWTQANHECIMVFSTRPLTGIKIAFETVNVVDPTDITVKYHDGTTPWTAVSGLVDGTDTGTVALGQDGTITWDAQTDALPYHYQGLYMYAYLITMTHAGSCNIAYITAQSPWQAVIDIWDGVYRQPIQCQLDNDSTGMEDYTIAVSSSTSLEAPIGAQLDGMVAADELYIMFEDRMSAIKISMLGALVNKAAETLALKYWDGDSWVAVSNLDDGTSNDAGTKCFNRSGTITWTPPNETLEQKRGMFGTTGYVYQITVTGKLTGTEAGEAEILLDLVAGIPAPLIVRPFKFSGLFKNRSMLGNYTAGKEGNRMDYSMKDAADVFNGWDSSLGGVQSLYFGGMGDLQCATELFNRFGSQVFAIYLVCKNNETYVLDGNSPEDYTIYPVSRKVGCPAPLTIDTAEVGFEMARDVQRNVAIWLSYSGPVMFDGAILRPIKGLETFFDPNSDLQINFDQIDKARGWVDSTYKEYNLILPMSTETKPNRWFIYDLVRRRWFEKDIGTAAWPQCGFPVYTSTGQQLIYSGLDTGRMVQQEKGTTWGGSVAIEQEIGVGDFFPSENIWHNTRIRYLFLVCKKIVEDADVEIYHFADTDDTGTDAVVFRDVSAAIGGSAGVTFVDDWDSDGVNDIAWAAAVSTTLDISLAGSVERLAKLNKSMNKLAWSHGFSFKLSTSSTNKGFRPLMWGIRWEYERHERPTS